jgi:hypothetical protein
MPSGAVIATGSNSFSLKNFQNGTVATGTVQYAVIRETGGTLDFLYQFSNDKSSTDSIGTASVANFSGYTTTIGWSGVTTPQTVTGLPASLSAAFGYVSPTTGHVQSTGDTVDFNFSSYVDPGYTSQWLEVQTNATQYGAGDINLIDNGISSTGAFSPTPEPSSLVLLGLGGLGMVGFGWRRRSRLVLA